MTMGRRIPIDDDVVALQGKIIRNLRNTLGGVLGELEEARHHAAALQRLVIELQGRLDAGGAARLRSRPCPAPVRNTATASLK
jgi:hypothetical protein